MLLIRPTPFNNLLYCCFGQWACELASPQTSFGVRLSRIHLTSAGRLPVNGPCPCSLRPRYQNEVKCAAFDMEMILHSHASKAHFHKKSCELCLILKVRIFGTRSGGLLFGSFNNDDGDGNKNFKKVTICTCVTLFCTFLCRHCSLLLCIVVEAGGGGGEGEYSARASAEERAVTARFDSLFKAFRSWERGK